MRLSVRLVMLMVISIFLADSCTIMIRAAQQHQVIIGFLSATAQFHADESESILSSVISDWL